ncbi:EndoU domain-containing protein [Emticicia oligotrophica]|nr:EndoU domain-containing protein [Emticicia oligotrophica]
MERGSSFKTGTIEFVEDANGEKWLKATTTASRYANYPNIQKLATHVLDEVDNLADDLLTTLETDLAGNSALKTAFEEDVSLLEVWKNVNHLNSFKGESKFLQALKKVKLEFNDLIDKHIFRGDIKKTLNADGTTTFGNAGGGHHISAVNSNPPYRTGDIQIISTANSNTANGLKECKIRVYDEDLYLYHQRNYNPNTNVPDPTFWGWKTKSRNSTLFPDSWTKGKMQEEIALAWSNKGSATSIGNGAYVYEGVCSEGFKIQFLERNGVIETIFPIL